MNTSDMYYEVAMPTIVRLSNEGFFEGATLLVRGGVVADGIAEAPYCTTLESLAVIYAARAASCDLSSPMVIRSYIRNHLYICVHNRPMHNNIRGVTNTTYRTRNV